MEVFRCFTEKKKGFDVEAQGVLEDIRGFLNVTNVTAARIFNRYDVEGISGSVYQSARDTIFSEPQVDDIYDETMPEITGEHWILGVCALPGQYDQRADSCAQCIQMMTFADRPAVKAAKLYCFFGNFSDSDKEKLKGYLINPVETCEAEYEKPATLTVSYPTPEPVSVLEGFISADDKALGEYIEQLGLAMDLSDIKFMQAYFRDNEKREPTITEVRVVDTYWSDHCRHTTFGTVLEDVVINDPEVKSAYNAYLDARREVYGAAAEARPQTLMDVATIAAKALKKRGLLKNIDISEEINACSIHIDVEIDDKTEDWLLMFKNETHNHPTEIEPFGGAATCIGGAIRDPLSGRSFVYQAMRVTGSGDPRVKNEDTLSGKLPQKKLTTTAARGYSSYGNQIGLAAGLVHEIYHDGYIAKRMEVGAVVGAVKADCVVRESPLPGDKVILLGGRTGRDGIGGATGSSKTHNAQSLVKMASEVQKGNAPEERKIQRLFRDPQLIKLIKRCNDFGAGGVSVAIGELADGLDIDLTCVRKKYEGLNATEIAISESQERMAVVTAPEDVDAFIKKAEAENLEAYVVAGVTESPRMVMRFEGNVIADLSREFLSSNGAEKRSSAEIPEYKEETITEEAKSACARILDMAGSLRYCSQRGLSEMFDGSVGASSVLMKHGGKDQMTPLQSMASLVPVPQGETSICSVMSFGFDPYLSSENPYKGAKTAVVTSMAKLVAAGCDPSLAYLSLQEFFERLREDSLRWGKPLAALLGALEAQMELEVAAIGGKDSMSGSFNELDVPPTLISFAIAPNDAKLVITPEFKEAGHNVVLFDAGKTLGETKAVWQKVRVLVEKGVITSAWAVCDGGAAEGIFKMALGNKVGFEADKNINADILFEYKTGAIIAEVTEAVEGTTVLGQTITAPELRISGETLAIEKLCEVWEACLEGVFPTKAGDTQAVEKISFSQRSAIVAGQKFAKPRATVFSFPGTNSEIDTARAVERAGGAAEIVVVRNLTPALLEESVKDAVRAISESQMIILPGGFAGGDEPDGSAKFITAFFRNEDVTDAVHKLLKEKDGLMLGICNGFQALVKLGLVPFGEIVLPKPENPTLTHNFIGRHQARYVYTRVASVKSPWMSMMEVGDIHALPVSHGEGRFVATDEMMKTLIENGQIATQYTDAQGNPSMDILCNPNLSHMAVEGIFSPDGRVFGKMAHTERRGEHVGKNIYGDKHQLVFESGVNYFK